MSGGYWRLYCFSIVGSFCKSTSTCEEGNARANTKNVTHKYLLENVTNECHNFTSDLNNLSKSLEFRRKSHGWLVDLSIGYHSIFIIDLHWFCFYIGETPCIGSLTYSLPGRLFCWLWYFSKWPESSCCFPVYYFPLFCVFTLCFHFDTDSQTFHTNIQCFFLLFPLFKQNTRPPKQLIPPPTVDCCFFVVWLYFKIWQFNLSCLFLCQLSHGAMKKVVFNNRRY